MFSNLTFDSQLLLLRAAVLVVLYLFVALAVMVVAGDLRRAAVSARVPRRDTLGTLTLADPGPTGLQAGKTFSLVAISPIGRALRNVVPIDDEFLSAEHALLTWREGSWWIEDLGSKNGTFLNGVRVTRAVPLARGDSIEVGRVVLRLE